MKALERLAISFLLMAVVMASVAIGRVVSSSAGESARASLVIAPAPTR